METAVETQSISSAERRFSNGSSDSTSMMTMMGPLTHRTATAICHTSTITSSTTVSTTATNTYELRLTTTQQELETEAGPNENKKNKKKKGEGEEDIGDDDDNGDVQVFTESDSDSASVSTKLSHPDRHLLSFREAVGDMVVDPDEVRAGESIDHDIVLIVAGAFEGSNNGQRDRINNDDRHSGGGRGGRGGGGLVPAAAAAMAAEAVDDTQQKNLAATQQQDCIFDYPDPRTTSKLHNNSSRMCGREDIIAPHAPFFPVLSPTTLRPQRFTKVPVVEEYIDPCCPPTPPPLPFPAVLLPPTPQVSPTSSPSTSDKLSNAVDTDDVHAIANQNVEGGGGDAKSLDKATIDHAIAQEVSPLHPLDYPPHHPPQQQQQHLPRNTNVGNTFVPLQPSSIPQQQQQQQQQEQPDRIRWRLSANYPPTRRIGGRSAATTNSIYGRGGEGDMFLDATSIHSSGTAPTTFVMIDTDGNQILTDPYTSSVTPPFPSPFSVAFMESGPSSGVGSGKALPAPVPLWLTNTVPSFHFNGQGERGNGSSNSSGGNSLGGGMISPTADPQVAAHITDALRMYGIPSLHQATTVHPFQRFSMTPSSSSPSPLVPIRPTSIGYEPPRGSTFPRLMYRSASRNSSSTVTSSSSPSRIVRVWAALTGRRHTSSSSSTTTSTSTSTTIAASNHGCSSRAATEIGTTSSTMTTHSRSSQLAQPPSSSSSSSLATTTPCTLQYEQLPFVQQPRRPTVVSPSPLARVSVVLRSSGSSSSARGSVLAADSSVTTCGGDSSRCDSGGNDGDGDGDGVGERGGGNGQQHQSRSILQNADDADNNDDDKDHAVGGGGGRRGEPSAFQKFLKVLLCGC